MSVAFGPVGGGGGGGGSSAAAAAAVQKRRRAAEERAREDSELSKRIQIEKRVAERLLESCRAGSRIDYAAALAAAGVADPADVSRERVFRRFRNLRQKAARSDGKGNINGMCYATAGELRPDGDDDEEKDSEMEDEDSDAALDLLRKKYSYRDPNDKKSMSFVVDDDEDDLFDAQAIRAIRDIFSKNSAGGHRAGRADEKNAAKATKGVRVSAAAADAREKSTRESSSSSSSDEEARGWGVYRSKGRAAP